MPIEPISYFPPTIRTSKFRTVMPDNRSLDVSSKHVRSTAATADEMWRARSADFLLPSLDRTRTDKDQSSTGNSELYQQEEEKFKHLQESILRQRQKRHRSRRKKQQSSADEMGRMTAALRKATTRCEAIRSHNTRTHLLDLCTNVLSHVSSGVSSPQSMPPGIIISLTDTVRQGLVVLSVTDPQDVVKPQQQQQQQQPRIKTKSRSRSRSRSRTDSSFTNGNGESLLQAHKKLWAKADKKRSERTHQPADLMTEVKNSLKDLSSAPVAINDWAEDILAEDMTAAAQNDNGSAKTQTSAGKSLSFSINLSTQG